MQLCESYGQQPAEARCEHSRTTAGLRAAKAAARAVLRTAFLYIHHMRTAPRNPKTEKPTKNARILLDVAIICTTFGPSDPSKRRESHCCFVNVRNLHPDSNKRMSRRVVTAPRLVGVHLTHYAMTGVGLLYYEVWMGNLTTYET